MVALYTVTIFVGAALLFLIEPMFARQVLPLLGGSPAVWNTAMLFFQAALLAGYAYAHFSTAWLGARRQAAWHVLVLLLPLLVLPIALPVGWAPPPERTPALWLLALMAVAVGLPFFAVSTTSPLLQRWFASIDHRRAGDPYFLYAASNAGSMLALLSYPLWLEPRFQIAQQSRLWAWGYGSLVALIAACAVGLWRSTPRVVETPRPSDEPDERPTATRRGRWVLLAFVPSSLMLGVTTFLSSEVAVVPLLWVVPLALYLLTFVLAFARRQLLPRALIARSFPILAVVWVLVLDMFVTRPIGGLMALHLIVFFVAALLCHTELAESRPPVARLTEYYLWVSLGGVLGGVFNALIAPLVFNSIAEYPIAVVLACWLALPAAATAVRASEKKWRINQAQIGDWLWPLLLGGVTLALAVTVRASRFGTNMQVAGLVFGAAALACYFFSERPRRFALGVGALILAGHLCPGEDGRTLFAERSFFGVHHVVLDPTGRFHVLIHGATVHGRQSLDPTRRREPLTYYHPSGPAGDVLGLYRDAKAANIGVVGLGAGSLASYAGAGQHWTYFEIDPVVEKIAVDGRYFTFLSDSPAATRIVLGDARQSLVREPDHTFDLLILDAYSSDAIPVHLVTREALALYLSKLAPGGRVAFHISNMHLDLEPVFANLARDAGLASLTRDDTRLSAEELAMGKSPSLWLVMGRPLDLIPLAHDPRWRLSRTDGRQRVWTDDYSSVLTVMRWQ